MDYPAIRIPADNHNAKSDLDPTEWKPKGKRDGRNSEAFRYLSQFHRASTSTLDENEKIARPYMHRSHASMTSMVTTPSLASTPTTATSSLSIDYDFNIRALPPRHNPMYSASAGTTKNIDLVTPHMVPSVVGSVPGDGSWEKKPIPKGVGGMKDGLLSKSMGK
jgi:ECL1/2/3 zinc binding proteins